MTEDTPDTPAATPESARPARGSHFRNGTTWVLVVLATAYVGGYAFLPPFRAYVREGLSALGLYEMAYAPSVRELVINERGRFLWGGRDESDHFDINVFRLEPEQLRYGLGRERFPALLQPKFETLAALAAAGRADPQLVRLSPPNAARTATPPPNRRWPGNAARVLVVHVGDAVRIYPLALVRRHEVINDVVGGVPIFAAYCYLADLAAVYDRRFGPHTLTFAVSGYTYHDPDVWEGRDAFLLWDRDTESLWWPPIGKAVSGPLIDTPMRVLDAALWSQTTWGEARVKYPDALVLAPTQSFEPPASWPQLDIEGVVPTTQRAVAPHWGEEPGDT